MRDYASNYLTACALHRASAAYFLRRAGEERRLAARMRGSDNPITHRAAERTMNTARMYLHYAREHHRMACPLA